MAGVDGGVGRIEFSKTQNVARIDRIRVADELFDLGDVKRCYGRTRPNAF